MQATKQFKLLICLFVFFGFMAGCSINVTDSNIPETPAFASGPEDEDPVNNNSGGGGESNDMFNFQLSITAADNETSLDYTTPYFPTSNETYLSVDGGHALVSNQTGNIPLRGIAELPVVNFRFLIYPDNGRESSDYIYNWKFINQNSNLEITGAEEVFAFTTNTFAPAGISESSFHLSVIISEAGDPKNTPVGHYYSYIEVKNPSLQ